MTKAFESMDDVRRQFVMDVSHPEIVVDRTVSHAERFDESLKDEGAVVLEGLAFVNDPDDLASKNREALLWFRAAIEEVDENEVLKRIAGG